MRGRPPQRLTYRASGVDIATGDRFVEAIKPLVRKTFRQEVLTDLGGFAGLFALKRRWRRPVLVSGTDGVGTKLKIAFAADRHDTVGIDLVAMCVNDIAVTGAEPLFFLDYFATGKLDPKRAVRVVRGIVEGCRRAGCALIGGETAQMPGFYDEGEYDLAGFAVGVVERDRIIDGKRVQIGDHLIGLASSGLHSNGYSLARKVLFEKEGLSVDDPLSFAPSKTVGELLLEPTRIYAKTILSLARRFDLRAAAHITGGGITENLPRVLPRGMGASVRLGSWRIPEIFGYLSKAGGIAEAEMFKTFNMGIGMILILPRGEAPGAVAAARKNGERAYLVGEVVRGRGVTYA